MSEQSSQWAIVELFGHKTIAGRVTKDTSMFPLLRIDVPATETQPEFTAEYGPGAIYGITYVSEAVAVAMANTLKVKPISVYSPELVTRAEFDKAKAEYQSNIRRLLDSPRVGEPEDDQIEDDEEDRDDGEGF